MFIGSDGVTFDNLATGTTYGCIDPAKSLTTDRVNSASKYRGAVLLDVAEPNGIKSTAQA